MASAAHLFGEGKSLYRQIMRLHRTKLDVRMRSLGDVYCRKEFRLHYMPDVKDSHRTMFLREWGGYVDMISTQGTVVGQELSAEQKKKLDDGQRVQLANLEKSSKDL
ncbi:unnamed protein product [Polarella glacialis]|uniref:Succinate dehydrogenase assembly factor 3 n=1 Tax=Polarella glacialis TaxID=89957 RepID=A0A813EYM7_POLGL|nr:unnamed protein product [Polarella glacialis]|mmetsp:Transcript_45595/g.82356  ORF Transcript_45595/g.82356 Transcript_45595/m.82356 type:complete len:107 (-) Transcript_45595:104-424(-)